jgi:hypothetical protein
VYFIAPSGCLILGRDQGKQNTMQELFSFFNQGWVGSLIGFVGIIVGAVGIFSYKISKSTAKLCFQKLSLRLLGRDEDNLPKEVTVLFKGEEVDRLTKTTLILWNNGTGVLEGNDVIPSDPIQIAFDNDDNILSYKILKRTKDVNNFRLIKNEDHPHQLMVNFDYLDPNDGVVLEMLHNSKKSYPKITGTIKGLPKGLVDLGTVRSSKQYKTRSPFAALLNHRKLIYGIAIFLGLSMAIFGLLPQELRENIFNNLRKPDDTMLTMEPIFLVVLGLLYASMPAFFLWSRRKKYPKQLEFDEVEH